jgi:hypothetical protein
MFWLGQNVRNFLRAMTPSWSAHGTFYLCLSYEKLPCALQDGVIWWRIFTSALVKFRTKYRLSDPSHGLVSILCVGRGWRHFGFSLRVWSCGLGPILSVLYVRCLPQYPWFCRYFTLFGLPWSAWTTSNMKINWTKLYRTNYIRSWTYH